MYFDFGADAGAGVIVAMVMVQLLGAILLQSVLEYWWHILMHQPAVYKKMHKFHHHYKSPEPFDDLFIHPLESFGYYCILYSIPFLMPVHVSSMLLYMMILGVFGVMDHSGIRWEMSLPVLGEVYSTLDHDAHHKFFDFNYGFPFPFLDKIHGTYINRTDER